MTAAPAKAEDAHKGPWLMAVLGVLLAFASISTDFYLPALPTMSTALGATQGTLELTISGYLAGFAVGQLFWGPLSDRFGRRAPLFVGIAVFVLGSMGCALSAEAWHLIAWRVVQALGASAGVVLARAMVRDLFGREQAAKALSTLMTILAIAPLLGPIIGGQILAVGSWQMIFWTLVAIGVATAAALTTIPETLPSEKHEKAPLLQVFSGYAGLLRHRRFMGYVAASAFFYAGIFAYIAGTPFAFIDFHHLSPQLYGVVFAAGIVGLMLANTLNSRLVTRFGSDRMLLLGTLGAAVSGVAVAVTGGTGWGGLFALAAALFLFVSMNGFILANAIAGALSSVPTGTGAASALAGFAQYGAGMAGSALVGLFANGTPGPMAFVILVAGVASLASVLLTRRIRD